MRRLVSRNKHMMLSAAHSKCKRRTSQRIAMECGTYSPWISRLLKQLGHQVIVANARKLRAISENESKNDRADAEMLARLAYRGG